MPKSRQDIQFKVVSILVGGDVGAPVSAEDADRINGYIDSEVDELNRDGTTYIADPDDLDDALFLSFCELVANAGAHEFGGTHDPKMGEYWRNRIRVIMRPIPGYGPQEVEFF